MNNKQRMMIVTTLLAGLIAIPAATFAVLNHDPVATSAATVITTKSTQTYIDNYYSSISSSLSGTQLKAALETRLQNERSASFSYGSLQSSAFPYTDVDPLRPTGGYIVSFYSGTAVSGYTGMNKEHTWPDSHGGNKVENDPHVIRPTLTSENSARGNQYYAESSSNGWDPDSFGNAKYRGIAARITFYAATIGHTEGLILEDVGRGQGSGTGNRMGKLGDLLQWNLQYPVDQTEIIRNETLDLSLNYNRNPFIDDTSFACRIWGDTNDNTRSICSQSSELESLSLSPSSSSLSIGATQSLTVTASPSGASTAVTWSSSNSSVASVSNGLVTANAQGTATITATSTTNTSIKATASITVNAPVSPTSLSLSPSSTSLSVGGTTNLSVTASPSGAINTVTWGTSNSSIALVNQGTVTAVGVGSATITATSTANTSIKATASITVTAAQPEASVSYSFTSKSWAASPTSWSSGKDGFGYLNNGVQVTASASGAFGNSPASYQNIKNVTVSYCTNASAGAGKISVYATSSPSASAKSGTLIASQSVTTAGGTSARDMTFTYASNGLNGHIQIFVETTTNSIYVKGAVVTYGTTEPVITPAEEAATWAQSFLSQTSSGCAAQNSSQLSNVWSSLEDSYEALSADAKLVVSSTTPNASGTDLQNAVARYIEIVKKYGLNAFIDGVDVFNTAPVSAVNTQNNTAFLAVFILIAVISSSLIVALSVKSKRQ